MKSPTLSKKIREGTAKFHKSFLATINPSITGMGPIASTSVLVIYPIVSVFKELLCLYSYTHQSEESKSREEKFFADEKARKHAIAVAVGFGLSFGSVGLEHYMSQPTHEQAYVLEQPRSRAEIIHQTQREPHWSRAYIPLLHFAPREETYSTQIKAQVGDWYCEGTIDGHVRSVEADYFSTVRLKKRKLLSGRLRTLGLEGCMTVFKHK